MQILVLLYIASSSAVALPRLSLACTTNTVLAGTCEARHRRSQTLPSRTTPTGGVGLASSNTTPFSSKFSKMLPPNLTEANHVVERKDSGNRRDSELITDGQKSKNERMTESDRRPSQPREQRKNGRQNREPTPGKPTEDIEHEYQRHGERHPFSAVWKPCVFSATRKPVESPCFIADTGFREGHPSNCCSFLVNA